MLPDLNITSLVGPQWWSAEQDKSIISSSFRTHLAQQLQTGRLFWNITIRFWEAFFSILLNAPLSPWKASREVNWETKDLSQSCWSMGLLTAEVERPHGSSGAFPSVHTTGIPVSYSLTLNPAWLKKFQRRILLTPDPLDQVHQSGKMA